MKSKSGGPLSHDGPSIWSWRTLYARAIRNPRLIDGMWINPGSNFGGPRSRGRFDHHNFEFRRPLVGLTTESEKRDQNTECGQAHLLTAYSGFTLPSTAWPFPARTKPHMVSHPPNNDGYAKLIISFPSNFATAFEFTHGADRNIVPELASWLFIATGRAATLVWRGAGNRPSYAKRYAAPPRAVSGQWTQLPRSGRVAIEDSSRTARCCQNIAPGEAPYPPLSSAFASQSDPGDSRVREYSARVDR